MLLTEPPCLKAAVLMSFVHEQRPNLRVEVFTEVENQKGWMIADVVENVTLLPDSVRFERYESFDGEDECRETGFTRRDRSGTFWKHISRNSADGTRNLIVFGSMSWASWYQRRRIGHASIPECAAR